MDGNTETPIQRAATAWKDLNTAESHISRIKRYPKQTAAMKADLNRHSHDAANARKTLDRLLVKA